jgi:hypothetical protein
MKSYVFVVLMTFVVISTIMAGKTEKIMIGASPVNNAASSETKKLLNYLYSISGKYTLTGQLIVLS